MTKETQTIRHVLDLFGGKGKETLPVMTQGNTTSKLPWVQGQGIDDGLIYCSEKPPPSLCAPSAPII